MKKREIFYSIVEYLLAALWIRGGINILFFDVEPVALPGIFTYLVGAEAIIVYGALFVLTGLAMVYAKLAKKKTLHKYVLMTMYLTCLYVLIIAIAVNGLHWGLWLTILAGIVSAALWVRWKFKTEYINPDEFDKTLEELRDDLPPNRKE